VSYNAASPLNLNNLSAADAFGTMQAVLGQPLVAMVRANGVPEPGTLTLAGVAALGLLRRRRA
jgi:MYXO-CTERM domain-containing protein